MTLPNIVTLTRLALVPFLIICFQLGSLRWALGLFLVASLTDWVDGWLARRLNQTSRLGAMLDPLVDKVLVSASLIELTAMGLVPAWTVILILAREFLITGLRTAAADHGISIPASIWGKAKTLFQTIAIALYLVPVPVYAEIAYGIALVLTIYSGAEYIYRTRRIWE